MQIPIRFGPDRTSFEVDPDRLVGHFQGPQGGTPEELRRWVTTALETPLDFPPLRRAVVPGDRVVLAFDHRLAEPTSILEPVIEVLRSSGIEPADTTLLSAGPVSGLSPTLASAFSVVGHDPSDRSQIAYLSSTSDGRRIYLNRLLIDADFVFPISSLFYDPIVGYRASWTTSSSPTS